jgi:hypothetical protein
VKNIIFGEGLGIFLDVTIQKNVFNRFVLLSIIRLSIPYTAHIMLIMKTELLILAVPLFRMQKDPDIVILQVNLITVEISTLLTTRWISTTKNFMTSFILRESAIYMYTIIYIK